MSGIGTSWKSGSTTKSLPNASNAYGTWGGVDFRDGTLPVIIHVTDIASHDHNYDPYSTSYVPAPHYTPAMIAAAQTTGTRIIQLGVGSAGCVNSYSTYYTTRCDQGLKWAKESNAVVPVCAFNSSTCLLGNYTKSPETINGKANQCALNFEGAYESVANLVSSGVDALVKYGTYEVSTTIEGVPIPGTSKNTSCFIKQVVATAYVAPPQRTRKIM